MSFGHTISWLLKAGWISLQWVDNQVHYGISNWSLSLSIHFQSFTILIFWLCRMIIWWHSSIASYFPSRLQPLHSRVVNSHVRTKQTQAFNTSSLTGSNWLSWYIHMMYWPGFVDIYIHIDMPQRCENTCTGMTSKSYWSLFHFCSWTMVQ